jgi:DNA-binding MarR family transcriptional regulator
MTLALKPISVINSIISQGDAMRSANYRSDLSIDEKVLMGVVRAAESFKRIFSAIFKKYDLSFPQYNILRVLDASTDGQSRITEVSRIMLVPGANMTGLAKRLERSGFIIRKSDAKDERATLLEITSKGKKTLKEIEKERYQGLKNMFAGFSKKEKQVLVDQVKRLIRNSRQKG